MGRAKEVISPDGDRWRVRRRWMDHRPPDLRQTFRDWKGPHAGPNPIDALNAIDVADGLPAAIGIALVTLVLVLVLLPLLGVAIELVLLLALTGWGLAAKLAFGRPWLVEAVNAGRPERSATYAVKGWERSGKAVDELAVAVSAGDPPKGLSLGPRVARRGPEG